MIKRIQVRVMLPEPVLEAIDKLIRRRLYADRQEFICEAIILRLGEFAEEGIVR